MNGRDQHLGERAAALVDGELGHEARDRALVHITGCEQCRHEVDVQRRLKARLRGLVAPGLPPELSARLTGLPGQPVLTPRAPGHAARGRRPMSPGTPSGPSLPRGVRNRRSQRPSRSRRRTPGGGSLRARRRHLRGAVLTGVSLLVAGLGVGYAAGGPRESGDPVSPPMARFVVEHVSTQPGEPLVDPAVGAAVTLTRSR